MAASKAVWTVGMKEWMSAACLVVKTADKTENLLAGDLVDCWVASLVDVKESSSAVLMVVERAASKVPCSVASMVE